MSKKKRYNPQYNKRKSLNLEDVSDTSDTLDIKLGYEFSREGTYKKIEEVPPPFQGEKNPKFISWSDLRLTYKVIAIACGIIITIVVPSIWFASGLNSKVTNLKEDVIEIKHTTKSILETTINNTSRLNYIEKDLDELRLR